MTDKSMLSIGDIAQRTGCAVSAIRFYADKGLIPVVRSSSGHRVFSRTVIRRVSFILISQNLGYSLRDIAKALDSLPDNRTPTKADWTRLSKAFCKQLDERIKQLESLKSSLNSCIGCGCLSLQNCHLYNPDDIAAGLGSGPRYLMGDKPYGKKDLSTRRP